MTTLDEHGLGARLDRALRLAQRAVDELLDAKAVLALNGVQRQFDFTASPTEITAPSEFDLKRVDL